MAKPSGDHTPLGGFVFETLQPRERMRRYWMYANYLIAMALAMFGWLWLIASFVRRLL